MEMLVKITDDEYFATPAASNSALTLMKQSPAHGKERLDNPPAESAAFKLGKLVHCLVLEPAEYEQRYHVAKETDPTKPRKKIVVDLIAAFEAEKVHEQFFFDEGDSPRTPIEGTVAWRIAEKLIQGKPVDADDDEFYVIDGTEPPKPRGKAFDLVDIIVKDGPDVLICHQEGINTRTKEGKKIINGLSTFAWVIIIECQKFVQQWVLFN